MILWLLNAKLHLLGADILWREIIGNAFGLVSVLFAMRRRVAAWPIGMAGNVLLFNKAMSAYPDDPSLWGQHLGDGAVPLGPLSGVRSATCAWDTSAIACVAETDFVLQSFAG